MANDIPNFRGYIASTAALMLGGLALVAMPQLIVDPFGVSPISVEIDGINTVKIGRLAHDRLVKPYDPKFLDARTIILGSSRVKQSIDPSILDESDLWPAYNAGIDAATPEELLEALRLRLWLGRSKPEAIFVEALVYAFGSSSAYETFAAGQPRLVASMGEILQDWTAMSLSLDGLRASYQTVLASMDEQVRRALIAPRRYRPPFRLVDDNGYAAGPLHHTGVDFAPPEYSRTVPALYGTLQLEEKAVNAYAEIAAICAAADIRLRFFAGPMHPAALVPIWDRGGREFYSAWLQHLGAMAPLYSFMLMKEAWDHKLSDFKAGWSDTTHFSPRLGAHLLSDLTLDEPRVGRLIDERSRQEHVAELERRLRAWMRDNPDYVRMATAH